jgi:hypothetical protein
MMDNAVYNRNGYIVIKEKVTPVRKVLVCGYKSVQWLRQRSSCFTWKFFFSVFSKGSGSKAETLEGEKLETWEVRRPGRARNGKDDQKPKKDISALTPIMRRAGFEYDRLLFL